MNAIQCRIGPGIHLSPSLPRSLAPSLAPSSAASLAPMSLFASSFCRPPTPYPVHPLLLGSWPSARWRPAGCSSWAYLWRCCPSSSSRWLSVCLFVCSLCVCVTVCLGFRFRFRFLSDCLFVCLRAFASACLPACLLKRMKRCPGWRGLWG